MREAGGRAVERALDIGIRPHADMIGIRPDFAGGEVPQGGTAKFSVIAADADGNRKALPGALWKLVKVERELPVVPQRQLLELRAGDLHRGGRQRHDRHRRRRRGHRSRSRSTGAATASRSRRPIRTARRPASSSTPAGMSTATLDRNAGRARNRARQGRLCAGRSRQAEGLAALRRRTSGHRRRRQAA